MRWYYALLLVLVAAIIQVAWGQLFAINGNPIPWVFLALWVLLSKITDESILTYGFIGGLLLDILSSTRFGMYTMTLTIVIGTMLLIEKQVISKGFIARLTSLVVGLILYGIIIARFPL